MAAGSLLALLDDIATVLDDVAVMSKVAVKKTAGVLGDDLALNAQQVSGIAAKRELPVVWAVFKGSMLNKLILVPLALLISQFAPWAIIPLLMIGGAYLCFEGFEKVYHKYFHKEEEAQHHKQLTEAVLDKKVDMVAFEKDKIKGAVRTDFILSAEIIAITLGVVAGSALTNQILVLSLTAIGMTVFVYGLVGGIVKIDDVGSWLVSKTSTVAKKIGGMLIGMTPYLMKALSILGTVAMFLVGGGIISHGIPFLHHFIEGISPEGWMGGVVSTVADGIVGIVVGGLVLVVVSLVQKVLKK